MTDEATPLRVQLLGPVRAWRMDQECKRQAHEVHARGDHARGDQERAGHELDLGGPQRRAVLAILASARHVSRDELIDGLWGINPPPSAENAIHVHISGLRRALEPGRTLRTTGQILTTTGQVYRLQLTPGSLDTELLTRHVADAQRLAAGSPATAVRSLDIALALSKGSPLAGIPGPWADIERARLGELWRTATADRVDILLRLGSHHQVLAELAALIRQFPLHERFRGQLMLALYRSGRQADALAAFDSARRVLAGQLGVDPGPALRLLQQQILTADPALDPPRQGAGGCPGADDGTSNGIGNELRRVRAFRARSGGRVLTGPPRRRGLTGPGSQSRCRPHECPAPGRGGQGRRAGPDQRRRGPGEDDRADLRIGRHPRLVPEHSVHLPPIKACHGRLGMSCD